MVCPNCGSHGYRTGATTGVWCGVCGYVPTDAADALRGVAAAIRPKMAGSGGFNPDTTLYPMVPPAKAGPVEQLREAGQVRERIVRALEAEVRDRPTAERLADAVVKELSRRS